MRLWYSVLMRCFPAEFRAEFEDEIMEAMRQQRLRLCQEDAGLSVTFRFHLFATTDLMRAIGIQRRAQLARLASVILFVAAAGNIGYDLAHPYANMGIQAWLTTVAAVVLSVHLFRTAERRRRLG